MRLIDADSLKDRMRKKDGIVYYSQRSGKIFEICEQILTMLLKTEPTVDAVVLPCKEFFDKMGDYIYVIDDGDILELLLCTVGFDANGTDSIISVYGKPHEEDYEMFTHRFIDVGKTIFLTRKEAKAALAERMIHDA